METLDAKDCLVYNVSRFCWTTASSAALLFSPLSLTQRLQIGSNNEIGFEQTVLQEIGCEIHTFDPTLRAPYIGYNYSQFHPWGLGVENQTVRMFRGKLVFQAKSIAQPVHELGHADRQIDILKIDCEGCEYKVMPLAFKVIQDETMQVTNQIQLEVHGSKR